MCGIFAVFGKDLSNNFIDLSKKSIREINHRGPDFSKVIKVSKDCILGHARLKIIDLSNKSNQPYVYRNLSLCFNGIIYNYLELKKNLQNFYKFKTNSDTEVILAAYLKYGRNAFSKFKGMYSIIIYDGSKIICARDPLGIKPLYYVVKGKNIYFSSETKPFLKYLNLTPNQKVIFDYLNYGVYEPNHSTFYNEIKQVIPGSILYQS